MKVPTFAVAAGRHAVLSDMIQRGSIAVCTWSTLWACTLPLVACGAAHHEVPWDEDAPVVIASTPADGDMAVDPDVTEVVVTFSRSMEMSGWSWVTEPEHTTPNINGIPFYADDTTAVLPVHLEPGSSYAVWVNSPDDEDLRKFVSSDGIAARAYRIRFHTR